MNNSKFSFRRWLAKVIPIYLIGMALFAWALITIFGHIDSKKAAQGVVHVASTDGVTVMRVYDRGTNRWIYFTNKGELMPERQGKR